MFEKKEERGFLEKAINFLPEGSFWNLPIFQMSKNIPYGEFLQILSVQKPYLFDLIIEELKRFEIQEHSRIVKTIQRIILAIAGLSEDPQNDGRPDAVCNDLASCQKRVIRGFEIKADWSKDDEKKFKALLDEDIIRSGDFVGEDGHSIEGLDDFEALWKDGYYIDPLFSNESDEDSDSNSRDFWLL